MLPVELVKEIDEFQDTQRIRGRNETIRTLIKKGLTASEE